MIKSTGNLEKAIKIALERGYRVTDSGKLISSYTSKPLKVMVRGKQRYPTFTLNKFPFTVSQKFGIPVHIFAARYFYGKIKKELIVRHLDGNVLNISKSNIKLGTHSQNNLDKKPKIRKEAAKKARAAQGYRAHNHKFTDSQVQYIRIMFKNGYKQKEIAEKFNVTRQCIYLIVNYKAYKDVTD